MMPAADTAAPRIDLDDQSVWRAGQRMQLPPKAFAVLQLLIERRPALVTKREILDRVWPNTAVTEAVLSVAVKQLRDALGDSASAPRYLETLHRKGFRWIGPGPTAPAAPVPPPAAATSAVAAAPSRMIGREAQLATLAERWAEALGGQPQCLFVTGEAGIGKSTLVDEFLSRIAAAATVPPLIARGQCIETFGSGEAYMPLLEAVGGLASQLGDAALAALLQRWAPTWLGQLPWLSPDAGGDNPMPTATSRDRMLREWCNAVEALVAVQPLVLVLEDLHWSDPSTLACVELLPQRRIAGPLLVLATYRPVDAIVTGHEVGALKQKLVQQRRALELPLWYLDRNDTAALLARELDGPVPAEVLESVQAQSEGHPLFILNVVEQLKRERTEVAADRPRHGDGGHDDLRALPDGLLQAIERNLAHLDDATTQAMRCASVIGAEFPAAGVVACLGADATATESGLESLARRGALLRTAGVRALDRGVITGRFGFVHALYRKVLYQQLAPLERTRIHRRYADWLAQHSGSAAERAHHYSLGAATGCAAQAVACYVEAADQARRLCGWSEAIEHYQRALRLHRDGGESSASGAELWAMLGATQQQAGMIAAARESLRAAAAAARAESNRPILARTALLLGHGYQRLGAVDGEIESLCEEALAGLGTEASGLRARLLAFLAFLLAHRPGTDARRAVLGAAASDCISRVDDDAARAWVLMYLRWSAWTPQSRATLARELHESRAIERRIAEPESRFMLLALIATDALEVGEHEVVDEAVVAWTALLHDSPIPWCEWFARRIEAARALHEGCFVAAERLATETLELGQRMDNPNVLPLFGAQTACRLILQGDFVQAAGIIEMAVSGDTPAPAWMSMLAYVRCEQGRLADAATLVARVVGHDFEDVARDTSWLIAGAGLALSSAALGDHALARRVYELLLPHRDRCPGLGSSVFGMGHMSRYLALAAATAGDAEAARAHFEESLIEQQRLRAFPWLALTQFDYARFLLAAGGAGDHRAALELRAQAGEIAARLGMRALTARLAEV